MASSKDAQEEKQSEEVSAVNLSPEELKTAIKKQVEYYFSRENLCQDAFLVSKMDAGHYVEVSVIADFKMVKQLTSDHTLILESVKDSDKVVCSEDNLRIKPLAVNARTTLILRNISSAASEDSVRALFPADSPKMVSLRADVGDNWFAAFETEDDTQKALEIAKKLQWEGKPIGCAIKSENLLKGLQPGGSPPKGLGGGATPGYFVPMQFGNNGYQYGYGGPGAEGFRPGAGTGRGQSARQGASGRGGVGGAGGAQVGEDGAARSRAGGGKSGKKAGRGGAREGGVVAGGAGEKAVVQQAPIDLSDFPQLVGSGKKEGGYTKAFTAFTKDEMVAIVKGAPPIETPHSSEGPFLAHRDTKLETDKNNNHADASDAPKPPANGSNGSAPDKDVAEKAAGKEAAAPAGKEGAPATNGDGPKKFSYAQMAQNGAKKEAPAPAPAAAEAVAE